MKILLPAILLCLPALAQGTEGPGSATPAPAVVDSASAEAKAAKELVSKYLVAVKAKKWAEAKKVLHAKTFEAIAERKKRLGREDHPLAPWFHEKTDYYLKDFKLLGAREAVLGAVIVETTEDNFQVEQKAVAEGDKAAYLVGRKDGKWLILDKKQGESFSDDSIKLGYKGWLDKVEKKDDPKED